MQENRGRRSRYGLASIYKNMVAIALAAAIVVLAAPAGLFAAANSGESVVNPSSDASGGYECLKLAQTGPEAALATLSAAEIGAAEELQAISDWNNEKKYPAKTGFSRPLPYPIEVVLALEMPTAAAEATAGVYENELGDRLWGGTIEVLGAHRLRLHLVDVALPAGSILWVYGETETVVFGLDLIGPQGDLWTPSVAGESISLEVRIPGDRTAPVERPGFVIDAVLELFSLGETDGPLAQTELLGPYSCYDDAACYNNAYIPTMEDSKHAIGMMSFISGGQAFNCTGGLLRDKVDGDHVPYFYTARHCIDTQEEASTLETYFDYIPSTCYGSRPPLDTLPRVNGSTLLETWTNSDSTLLRLNANPSGYTYYLGWTDAWVPVGTTLTRLSHPVGYPQFPGYVFPQIFSQTAVTTPRRDFCKYSTTYLMAQRMTLKGTGPGADGAPSMDQNGLVRGHYSGQCQYDREQPCDPTNDIIDGRFSEFYPQISKYIDALCVADGTTLCLNKGRFSVRVDWNAEDGRSGQGQVVPYGSDTSGLFWFFNQSNWEMLIKVLDGCGYNNRYWVFFAATTDQEFTVTVTDTETGAVKQYLNPMKHPADAVTDTGAFATCQ